MCVQPEEARPGAHDDPGGRAERTRIPDPDPVGDGPKLTAVEHGEVNVDVEDELLVGQALNAIDGVRAGAWRGELRSFGKRHALGTERSGRAWGPEVSQ
jgi:hypothetical protein